MILADFPTFLKSDTVSQNTAADFVPPLFSPTASLRKIQPPLSPTPSAPRQAPPKPQPSHDESTIGISLRGRVNAGRIHRIT